jgi:hypothetical protein
MQQPQAVIAQPQQHQIQSNTQRQLPPPTQMHQTQMTSAGGTSGGMMLNTSTFDMPSTNLHRPQSATLPNSFANSPMFSSSLSLHNYNIHGTNDDDSMFNSLMMDNRSTMPSNSQITSNQMLANPESQYEMIRNPQSVDSLNMYGANRNEQLDTPVFGTAPVSSHLSIDGTNTSGQQQPMIDMQQRSMSVPSHGNQMNNQHNQQHEQGSNNMYWQT